MVEFIRWLSIFLLVLIAACANNTPTSSSELAVPGKVAVASASQEATRAGLEVLKAGGNAFDAAIAISAALGVTEPYSSGFGGGGLWLLHRASDGKQVMIDGRERAPLNAHRDMYLDNDGEVEIERVRWGALAAGIPGMPAGLVYLAENYGRLPLSQSLQGAIDLAENGFPASHLYVSNSRWAGKYMNSVAKSVFLDAGKPVSEGDLIVQKDLADTIRAIVEHGHNGFYAGAVAEKLIAGTNAGGGIWSQRDFDEYEIVERNPIVFEYNGSRFVSASPPSSGGIAMAGFFNILEGYDLDKLSESERTHVLIEAMRRVYRDRAEYLGDTDFVAVPIDRLTSKYYAAGLRQSINLSAATPSRALSATTVYDSAGADTTHFSVIDSEGNRVAATLTINFPFGSGYMPPGTGVLLNNEMDDFSAKIGVPNGYGLIGGDANAIAPGKRMLSSMTPTFIESGGDVAILGTPGGSRIISMVMLASLQFLQGASAEDMVDLPRIHHQYFPDKIELEPDAMNADLQQALLSMGHELETQEEAWGNMHVVLLRNGDLEAASDKRGVGLAEVSPVP